MSGANGLDRVDESSALGVDHQDRPVRRERRVDQSRQRVCLAGAGDANNRHVTRQFVKCQFEALSGAQCEWLTWRTNNCPEVRVGLGAIERLVQSDVMPWRWPPEGKSDD